MAITPGKACVNRASRKPSYLALESDVDVFSPDTGIVSAIDELGDAWNATPVFKGNKKILQIKLKGTRGGDMSMLADADPAPDVGQLTITLANPAVVVPVPVDYVDDPNP